MREICEYCLYEGPTEGYHQLCIPTITKLKLPKGSKVLSVLAEHHNGSFLIKAYVDKSDKTQQITKIIAMVTTGSSTEEDVGWCFLNSLVISTGAKDHPQIIPYHAYVKIC